MSALFTGNFFKRKSPLAKQLSQNVWLSHCSMTKLYPFIKTVNCLTHSVWFSHCKNCEKHEFILIKYLTQDVWSNHCSVTICTPNQNSKLANTSCLLQPSVILWKTLMHMSTVSHTKCMLKSLFNDQIYP